MAAAAYAAASAGIIFDHEEGRVFTPQQANELIAKFISDRPNTKAFLEDIERKFGKKP